MTNSLAASYLEANNKILLVAEGYQSIDDGSSGKICRYGILVDDIKLYWERGMGVQIAQLYEIVIPGLILSKHLFQGVKRPLYCDNTINADESKLVFSRVPAFDVIINRGLTNGGPVIEKRPTPAGKTFVVIVSPNIRHRTEYPTIDGWLDRWNWVPEDSGLPEAPENWVDRYDKKIYTRGAKM